MINRIRSKAETEGWLAGHLNQTLEWNPYKEGSGQFIEWGLGFEDGQKHLAVMHGERQDHAN